ncbi:MAG: hypothetical protein QW098_00670 [Candidatus Hadarchaeales archaeon]
MEGGKKRVKYLPAECIALEVLEYMILMKEKGPFTLYQLMNHGVKSRQRRDRMRQILELMVERGWVEVVPGYPRRYQVTAKGEEIYHQTREFREFSRSLRFNRGRSDREVNFFYRDNSLFPSLNTGAEVPSNKKGGEERMKVVIRKLGASGDTCLVCAEQELQDRLQPELEEGYQVAIRTGEGTRLLGEDLEAVESAVKEESGRGAVEVELLLVPRVTGG